MSFPQSVTRSARAVVTGAGSGIGAAIARELAARNSAVVCADLNEASAQKVADAIVAQGGEALAVACDVRDRAALERLAAQAGEFFGANPSLIVNNAGIGAGGVPADRLSLEDWQQTIDTNLWSVIHGCHIFVPLLRGQAHAGVLNIASTASFSAAPTMASYNVSKAGVLALTETLHAELKAAGIHVTAVCPTFVKTGIVEAGRMTNSSKDFSARAMRMTGVSAEMVARKALKGLERNELYVLPQLDARLIWSVKRHLPRSYSRLTALVGARVAG